MSDPSLLSKSKDAILDALAQSTEALGINPKAPTPAPPALGATEQQQPQVNDEGQAKKEPAYVDESLTAEQLAVRPPPDGSQEAPFPSAIAALVSLGLSTPLLVKKSGADSTSAFEPITSSGLKKASKLASAELKKRSKLEAGREEAEEKAKVAEERERKKREEASEVVLVEDQSLPKAVKSKIAPLPSLIDTRVRVSGWVHRLRQQKDRTFITLRDGSGLVQVVLGGQLIKTLDALTLNLESSVQVHGTVQALPAGAHAPGGIELVADWWTVLGKSPGGDEAFSNKVTADAAADHAADNRHLFLRGETASAVMKVRHHLLSSFRASFAQKEMIEVTPPAMVQTSVEGGSTLFTLDFYGEKAYLTQSSQLYLETCLPSLGDVFCIQESFRAEKSFTRRHLSEYTHLEAELAFLTFDELLEHIEDVICTTIDRLMADPKASTLIHQLNPDFVAPQRPFLRMDYRQAIRWLIEHDIPCEDEVTGELRPHRDGDDIAEAAERKMTDILNVPMFLTRFPKAIKAFYMKKCLGDEEYTESCDLLMPGVGEIVGGSMRIADMAELLDGYKREGIDPAPYYWFTDQRKYGTCEHGGYGLGVERFLAWLTKRWTVREASLYPRWTERCKP